MLAAHQISQIIKGVNICVGRQDLRVDNILVDSRKINHPQSSIFIPICTSKRNAHQFIYDVYNNGVRCFLVSEQVDIEKLQDAWIISVPDTLVAFQALVSWHRKQFSYPVIGITGSNGKTIVKEWLFQLLAANYNIVRSPKSYNSQIGVPLSVWQMQSYHNLAIFEAGISQPNEMDKLQKIIKPDWGIFTNIGETHNEGFLNTRHKINEKLKLFTQASILIYNKDYLLLHESILHFASQIKHNQLRDIKCITWSKHNDADLVITDIQKKGQFTQITATYQSTLISIQIPFTDDAYIEDSIHCWLVLLYMGISANDIQQRMLKLLPIAMRLELLKGVNNCTLINDSYNSDISSFAIALDFLSQQNQHTDKTVILSDIYQSGRENELYEEVTQLLKQKKIRRFIGVGETIQRYKPLFRQHRKMISSFYKNTDEFLHAIDTSSFSNETILIKGARKFEFEKIAKRLQERIHQTVVEINLNNLLSNYKAYLSKLRPGTGVMAMVKAFSYGSGSYEIANALQFEGVKYLAVAYTDEGVALRKSGITLPIMVMNPDEHSYEQIIEWNLEPEIYNFRTLHLFTQAVQAIEKLEVKIHIKLDTGMHRLGFEPKDMTELCAFLAKQQQIQIASVFTHLVASEDPLLDEFTNFQANLYQTMALQIEKAISYPFLRHVCNSSAIARYPAYHFDMVRLGLGLYGIDNSSTMQSALKNVSTMKSVISQIKWVKATETVGYNRKGVLSRDTCVGTVCVGYADGIPRSIGNGIGKMWIHGQFAPIIGNVCMDMCMLDLTDIEGVQEGDPVIVFGNELPVNTLAQWANTIPYEILTGISQRVKRVYYEE